MDDNKLIFSMNMAAALSVEQLAKETGKSTDELLISFLKSNTGKMLYDDSTKLWWDGPAAVAQEYKAEMEIDE